MSTKHMAFQYRTVNFAIITNIHLKKWGKIESENCRFCQKTPENYIHMFVECEVVKNRIWIPVNKWLYHFCLIELTKNTYEIMFCKYKDSFPKLVNLIILMTKYYIYVQRCLKKKLNFIELATQVAHMRSLEEAIAKKQGKQNNFIRKWSIYDLI